MAIADINAVIRHASVAMPKNLVVTKEGTPQEGYGTIPGVSGVAGSTGRLRLMDQVPRVPETTTQIVNQRAGALFSLAQSITEGARVMQAGARLIPVDMAPEPEPNGLMWSRAGAFTLVNAAVFSEGDEIQPLTAQPLPTATENIDVDLMESYGVRFKLDRRIQKDITGEELNARLVNAIAYGLVQAIDEIALTKLGEKLLEDNGGSTMPTYSLSSAAAKGLRFGELKAIVGTEATGASVEDGVLRVSGVPAELTNQHASTFVGAWDRSAVAVMDDIRIIVERLNVDGSMSVTCWLDAVALLPDSGFFWSAA